MTPLQSPHLLANDHNTTSFDCGEASLNDWLQQRALANQHSGATRTFVVCTTERVVKAYVALASGSIVRANSPGGFRRNMPDPIPVVVLARLAVCRSVQKQGIARDLLTNAFERVLQVSEQIGVRGIIVHSTSQTAKGFYLHMGFDPSPTNPDTLLLRLSDMATALRSQAPASRTQESLAVQPCGD